MSSNQIRIDTEKLDDISQQLSRLSSSLASIGVGLAGISVTARLVVSEQPDIIRNINSLKNRVSASQTYARRLSGAVQDASARWAKVESELASQALRTGDESESKGTANGTKTDWNAILDFLLTITGGAGAIGTIISAATWSFFGSGDPKDWAKVFVDIGEVGVDFIIEGLQGSEANWVNALFGVEAITPTSFIADGIKAMIDNWDLLDDNPLRFATETITETLVNAGLNAVGIFAAGAILGAGAPGIVVGAAGAGLVWLANAAAKAITGKNIAENVGEIVGNVTDYIASGQMAKDISRGLEKAWDTGTQVVADMCNTAANWFNSIFG